MPHHQRSWPFIIRHSPFIAVWSLVILCSLVIGSLAISKARGADSTSLATNLASTSLIDLPTALRLAGARSLDVQIAQEKLAEAKANKESALWQFFPTLTPGASYRRHDNFIQDVGGNIFGTHKQSYTVGPTLAAQVDIGDALYRNLASRQLVKAADHALESQRQETILAAAQGYFELARAQLAISVAQESFRISTNYASQVQQAVNAGIAFKADLLRVQVQTERTLVALRQAQEQRTVSSARLVDTLHLDSKSELTPRDDELLPIELVSTNASLGSLLARALEARPELKEYRALTAAAREENKRALYGPIIPTLGAQVFAGGLGGGKDGAPSTFGESEDYVVTLGWRIGPGGLFDRGRIQASESRLKTAQLSRDRLIDEITREVVESLSSVQSQNDQAATTRRAITAAEETLRLTQARKEFAVGAVLETIQAEQDLTRTRLDYLNAVTEYDKAQYRLQRALGGLSSEVRTSSSSPP